MVALSLNRDLFLFKWPLYRAFSHIMIVDIWSQQAIKQSLVLFMYLQKKTKFYITHFLKFKILNNQNYRQSLILMRANMEDQTWLVFNAAQILLFLFKSQKTIARYGCWPFNRQLLHFFRKEPQHNKHTSIRRVSQQDHCLMSQTLLLQSPLPPADLGRQSKQSFCTTIKADD